MKCLLNEMSWAYARGQCSMIHAFMMETRNEKRERVGGAGIERGGVTCHARWVKTPFIGDEMDPPHRLCF